ncbi:hypothetical protein H0486_11720 [Lachnospiraceae bacterium MD1]|uniref:Alpha/beta hydrolase n=1 Tax=Variimorphobacter saccharofermentans TaxID=2755051 RepID=A0A839K2X2_9FIRM|nr:alpha/beta hydrolase [Variimorphobacter saccharofermentans]MBB2183542.1 hypothetical protein [Variimorphobacter saccharofermentans]
MIIQKKLLSGEFVILYCCERKSDYVTIMCPGLGFSKVGPYFLLANIARNLYKEKVDTILFDYFGQGDSEGDFYSMSYETVVQSTKNILEYAYSKGYRNIILVGFGIGNLVCNELCIDPNIKMLCLIDYNADTFEKFDIPEHVEYIEGSISNTKEGRLIRNFVGLTPCCNGDPISVRTFKYKPDILYNYKICNKPVCLMDNQTLAEFGAFLNSLEYKKWNDERAFADAWDKINEYVVKWILKEIKLEKVTDTRKNLEDNNTEFSYSYEEKEVYFEVEGMQGVLSYPVNYDNTKTYECIIYEPGLGGERVDHMRTGVLAAREFVENEYFFFRYDYAGCGVSEGDFYKYRWGDKYERLVNILEFIKNNFPVKSFGILSYSEGAKVAVWACRFCDDVKAVVMWSPVLINGFINYQGLKDGDAQNVIIPRFIKNKKRGIVLPTQAYYLGLEYFSDQKKNELYENLNEINKPIKIFYGLKDPLFQEDVYCVQSDSISCEIVGEGHLFNYQNTLSVIKKSVNYFGLKK